MTYPMNLRKIGHYYRIWFSRGEMPPSGRLVSMREIVGYSVTDKNEAQDIYSTVKKNWHKGKIIELEQGKRVPLDIFAKEYLASRKDKSPDTLRADSLALRSLGDVLGNKIAIQAITAKGISRFKTASLSRGLSSVSLNTYLRHIKAALNQAYKWEYIKKVPIIENAEVPEREPRILTKDEIDGILKESKTNDKAMFRIISFALWTGTRRKEIHSLKWQDIKDNLCRVIGKGDKQRTIPLSPKAMVAVGVISDIGPVFEQCHVDGYSKRFKAICQKVGIKGVKFHTLRHSAASYMIQSGMHPDAVQKIMGHTDYRTTQIYVNLSKGFLEKEMEKLRF